MGGKEWEESELSKARNGSVMYVCEGFKHGDLKFNRPCFQFMCTSKLASKYVYCGCCFGLPHCQIYLRFPRLKNALNRRLVCRHDFSKVCVWNYKPNCYYIKPVFNLIAPGEVLQKMITQSE